MRFEIERDLFVEGISKAVPITEKRTTLPILSHLLLEPRESQIRITATDLEVGLRLIYPCSVEEEGALAIPSKKLYEIVRELSSGPMQITLVDALRIRVIAGKSTFELAGMDAGDYPAWSLPDAVECFPVQASSIVYMIDKTLFASSNDESRYNLNGVLFEPDGALLRMVATDGHRLATIERELGIALSSKQVIPKKGLLELRRVIDGLKGEEIRIGFEEKNLVVRTDRFDMTVRLTDGEYPEYRRVIPDEKGKTLKADRLRMLQAAKRVAVLCSDRNKGVTIAVNGSIMNLSALHPDLGTAEDSVEVEYEGEEFSTIVNGAYLIEALHAVDSETTTLEFHREGKPIILRPDPVKEYFNLVMPMKK